MDVVSDAIIKATDEYILDTPEDRSRKEQARTDVDVDTRNDQSWFDTTQLKKQVSTYFEKVEAGLFPTANPEEEEEDARNESAEMNTAAVEHRDGREVSV